MFSLYLECNENDHVNNLIGAHSKNVNGWTFTDIDSFQQDPLGKFYKQCGNGQFWFGFGIGTLVGSIETQLKGCDVAMPFLILAIVTKKTHGFMFT